MFPVPDINEIRDQQLRDIKNALPGENIDTGTDSDYCIRAMAVAGAVDGLYAYQAWIIRQIFADTADPEFLELHCRTRGVYRKNATTATGLAVITGTEGKTLAAGAEIRAEGVSVTTTADCVIDETGAASVAVRCVESGAAGDTNVATMAALVSPPEGISSAVTVGVLSGGTDTEDDASLLARYLEVVRRPAAGGNKYDFKRWALEVDGVTAAYVAPLRRGLGTVDIAIISDDDTPPPELVVAVQAYIDDKRPVTAKNTLVLAPDKRQVDFVIQVRVSGVTIAQITPSIELAINDFINRLEPGQELILSQLETQISLISGITDREIISPAENVKAVINENTWEWLRAGTISVGPLQ